MPPTGDLSHNPGMCPDWESNQKTFRSQARAQSTELHQPGLNYFLNVRFGVHWKGCWPFNIFQMSEKSQIVLLFGMGYPRPRPEVYDSIIKRMPVGWVAISLCMWEAD